MSTDPMEDLRRLHRPGTDDLATAIAFARAAAHKDWDAQLSLVRGLDQDDDLLGVVLWLAQVAGHALNVRDKSADEVLDRLARVEREHAR